ncbi:CRISPR system precrRNA processing endoribonuclease RAMP protein Cas6 [Roseospira marina]|uniref:CRISPR system precrRNA processing endoribonuclease RAMP protein Cas6 n=1 Tax=Roseospira marina TaxID=140057 RepID=A0A5M6I7A7_9PROT|nr:CRISPR system precrRNA processing endoribonuclease RAMP protein Cas6 [Roseospira marina]KAA5603777.1 CRISPR system precrRNA processing endoribonuclease RAMP protein Cas6 [Roseospira marina]MBB4316098.1 hypothetical protein [Roseospira marina]MBB5089264.1 hypothetical protein [Roseospira marina]
MTATAPVLLPAPLWHDVSRACEGHTPPATHPVLLGRLRGLLGQDLADRLSRQDHAALFPASGQAPSPLVPRIDGPAHGPTLTIRLIGTASRWADPVAAALAAVTEEGLIVPGGRRPLLGRGPILWQHDAAPEATAAPGPGPRVVLETPLCLAEGATLDGTALGRAVRGRWRRLAPWLDPDLIALPALSPPEDADWRRLRPVGPVRRITWTRIAHRQGERPVPMHGWIGAFGMNLDDADRLLPWLRLAQALHAGRHAAFGLGRVGIRDG